jgi:hypothetical protein
MTVNRGNHWNHAVSWKVSAGRLDSFKRGDVQLGEKRYFQPHIDVIPTHIQADRLQISEIGVPVFALHLSGVLRPVMWG